jgi:hypothetical protein
MSQRFTPITSDLLARKGEASPSAIKPSLFWRRPPLAEARPQVTRDLRLMPAEPVRDLRQIAMEPSHDVRTIAPDPMFDHEIDPVPANVVPPMPPEGPRPHKMMVTLSHADYEKLGIAAVKKGVTRQQMLRVAVDLHIDRLKREYGGCGCMAMGGTGQCGEGCGAH